MGRLKKYMWFFYFSLIINPLFGQVNAGFKLGLENISDQFIHKLQSYNYHGARIGLITNHTGKDQQGNRNVDILRKHGLHIAYIFTPEHGFDGTVPAAHEVRNTQDVKTHVPIISLYGKGTGKDVMHQNVQHIDMFMFDMQDVGMRHYTYISTLLRTMQTAAEHDKEYIVLDRPNPLGSQMEGTLVSQEIQQLNSFIAAAPVPLRHGMTIGELALYFNAHVLTKSVKLHVIKMQNYDRRMGICGELQENLSPNIQSKQACYGYSFLGLLGEVRPFGTGIGSNLAFSYIGLPDIYSLSPDFWKKLQNILKSASINSVLHTYYSDRSKKRYHGLRIQIADINKVKSFDTLLSILTLVKASEIPLQFSDYFNRAIGTDLVQQYIDGKITKNVLAQTINKDLRQFFIQARKSFMYLPFPQYNLMPE